MNRSPSSLLLALLIRFAARLAPLALALLLAPRPAFAQASEATARQAPPARIYVGMWSTHFRDLNRGLDNNRLVGVVYRGYYGGTFINSFGDRALSAGIQRRIAPSRQNERGLFLGFRAGLITGYDERFLGIASWSPVIPFAQLIGSLDTRRIGVELAYAGVVASVATSIRL